MTPMRKTARLIDQKPKLRKLVAQFKKSHRKYCDDLCQATYRLVHDAAKIGNLVMEMRQEGDFRSYRELHVWLDSECGSSIPERTFYRYVTAAKDAKTVEVVHGKEKLTEVGSLKALKMLANPITEHDEPGDLPKPALDEPPPNGWKGWSIRHNPAHSEVKDAEPKDDKTRSENDKNRDVVTLEQAEFKDTPTTNFHHGCKDFKIDDDRTLSFTNQHGDRVVVVSEKKGIERLLVKAINSYTGKGGKQ